ncbi:MAG: glycoside hydrolase family 5 protein [Planctomycetales bacterium]|nr:glycoside hydrolase family 5 protein [Planctomycetales bacterium]
MDRDFAMRTLLIVLVLLATMQMAFPQTESGSDLLGRGINLGNMMEASKEGDWGLRFEDDFPTLIKEAGFEHVRIPIRWSTHSSSSPPYLIEDEFINRVKHVVDACRRAGLKVIVNVHHFEPLYAEPDKHHDWLNAIWQQISTAFVDADDQLYFEILNEPHGELNEQLWNSILIETLAVIRRQHPHRWVIIGPAPWNGIGGLDKLSLPSADQRLIVTAHYYLPFKFTHQGASWVDPTPPPGTTWLATAEQVRELEQDFDRVAAWGNREGRPIYIGEFGAYQAAPTESRVVWTKHVREACERRQFGWAYWELAAGFGVLDKESRTWRADLLKALVE